MMYVPITTEVVVSMVMTWLLWRPVSGRPEGAPLSTCLSMTPQHGSAQTTEAPYSIYLAEATRYQPGTPVQVTISGGTFTGVLLQARRKGSTSPKTPVGSFTTDETKLKTMSCSASGDSVTHSGITGKSDVTVMWMPPDDDVGEIEFIATVARAQYEWWLDVTSPSLTHLPAPTTTTTTTTTTSTPPTSSESITTEVEGSTRDLMTEVTTVKTETSSSSNIAVAVTLFVAPGLAWLVATW